MLCPPAWMFHLAQPRGPQANIASVWNLTGTGHDSVQTFERHVAKLAALGLITRLRWGNDMRSF